MRSMRSGRGLRDFPCYYSTVQLGGTGDDQISSTSGVTDNGTFDLSGHSEGIDTLTGNGVVKNSSFSQASTFTVGENNGSSTFTEALFFGFGPIALTKAGTGTLALTSLNQSVGPVTVNGGTLLMVNHGGRPLTVNSGTFVGDGGFGATNIMGGGALALSSFSTQGLFALLTASSLSFGPGNTAVACRFGSDPRESAATWCRSAAISRWEERQALQSVAVPEGWRRATIPC